MSDIFNSKVIKEPKKIGGIVTKTVQIYKNKGKRITEKEIETLVHTIEKSALKKNEKIKIAVYGLNGDRIRNLKGFNTDLHVQTYDDYHNGIEFESPNFIEFYQLNIVINKYIHIHLNI